MKYVGEGLIDHLVENLKGAVFNENICIDLEGSFNTTLTRKVAEVLNTNCTDCDVRDMKDFVCDLSAKNKNFDNRFEIIENENLNLKNEVENLNFIIQKLEEKILFLQLRVDEIYEKINEPRKHDPEEKS